MKQKMLFSFLEVPYILCYIVSKYAILLLISIYSIKKKKLNSSITPEVYLLCITYYTSNCRVYNVVQGMAPSPQATSNIDTY